MRRQPVGSSAGPPRRAWARPAGWRRAVPGDGLHVALGRPLVVGLGEALGGDQLVLELGGVAVGQRIPVARPIGGPDAERPPGQRRRLASSRANAGEPLRSIATTGRSARDLLAQDPQQRGRLARAAGADDQAVGRQLVVVSQTARPRSSTPSLSRPPPAAGGPLPAAASSPAARDASRAPARPAATTAQLNGTEISATNAGSAQ